MRLLHFLAKKRGKNDQTKQNPPAIRASPAETIGIFKFTNRDNYSSCKIMTSRRTYQNKVATLENKARAAATCWVGR